MTAAGFERTDVGVRALAAELHDGLAQQLFAASLDLHELLALPGLGPDAREILDRLRTRIDTGNRELRAALVDALHGTHPAEPALSVLDAIRSVTPPESIGDVAVSVQVFGGGPEPVGPAARMLVRAAREGVANAAKHAGAARVQIVLRRGRRWWTVEVHDDGTGAAAAVRSRVGHGQSLGLASLAADAARLGGRLWIADSASLGGIAVSASVPITA
ncbi:MAG: sensor histidine kinase [Sporichthyaceae bacterium]